MTTFAADVLDLFDYAWLRLRERLAGLTDAEWAWLPTPDARIGLRWRLDHLAALLSEERNAGWLGLEPDPASPLGPFTSAVAAQSGVAEAFLRWRAQLAKLDEPALVAPIGAMAGRFGAATRRSFALHIADEFIHHGAEVALLRDLYRAAGP